MALFPFMYGGYWTLTEDVHDYVIITSSNEVKANMTYHSYGPLPGIY